MKEYKIRTHGNTNLSKAIQDELFKLGYGWEYGDYYNEPITEIFTLPNGELSANWEEGKTSWDDHSSCQEVTINDLITLRIAKEQEESVKELTHAQICKELGYNVKIVKE